MRSPHCREEVTRSPDQTATVASLQGFRRLKRSSLARKVGSEGAARRRDASRVPQMCPKCVRLFDQQTTTKCRFAGTLLKPSDGLEPSTPSLPWKFRRVTCVHTRSLLTQFCLEFRPFWASRMRRTTSRVSFLMCLFCVRRLLPTEKTPARWAFRAGSRTCGARVSRDRGRFELLE
jgi:hypothetical protein